MTYHSRASWSFSSVGCFLKSLSLYSTNDWGFVTGDCFIYVQINNCIVLKTSKMLQHHKDEQTDKEYMCGRKKKQREKECDSGQPTANVERHNSNKTN